MGISEQIKILAIKLNVSVAEIARRAGQSPQNFNQKMKRQSFTIDELKAIAKAVGCDFEATFIIKETGDRV